MCTATYFHLRPVLPSTDESGIAFVVNAFEQNPVSVETVREWLTHDAPGRISYRRVAVNGDDAVVGYAVSVHETWDPEKQFYAWAGVAPACRGRGIGAALYSDMLAFLKRHNAGTVTSEVRDDCAVSQAFARRRGFENDRHLFQSSLDLEHFDDEPYAQVFADYAASGLRVLLPRGFRRYSGGTQETLRSQCDHRQGRAGLDRARSVLRGIQRVGLRIGLVPSGRPVTRGRWRSLGWNLRRSALPGGAPGFQRAHRGDPDIPQATHRPCVETRRDTLCPKPGRKVAQYAQRFDERPHAGAQPETGVRPRTGTAYAAEDGKVTCLIHPSWRYAAPSIPRKPYVSFLADSPRCL